MIIYLYIAIGLDLDGRKDVLGMWVGENESAKFWATVLNGLRNRGVEDIFIACTDNLNGFDTAIHAVFPETEIQNCMIHQLRKVTKSKSVFPTDDSLLKMLYLAMMDITKKWTGRRQDWSRIHAQLSIYFAERMPD